MAPKEEILKKKEQLFRGETLENLKSLGVRESAKFLKSRCRRAILRNYDKIEKFVKHCETQKAHNKKIKTHLRDTVIVPQLVGYTISIHNGQHFQEVPITIEMIGHRLGEFAMTRGKVSHGSAGIGATKSSKAQKK